MRLRPELVRDIVDALQAQRPLAYTTVMTVMDNLHRKGWLAREPDGRAWRYHAVVSREAYTAGLMNDALVGSADPAGALAHFVEQIDADDGEALLQVLAASVAQRRGKSPR